MLGWIRGEGAAVQLITSAAHVSRRRVALVPPSRDVVLVASLLALGVIAWEHFFHSYLLGVHSDSVLGHVLHWLRDSSFAFLPALLAAGGGLWLARRLDRTRNLAGTKILELIQDHYTEQRFIRTMGDDGKPREMTINERTAAGAILNDIRTGKYT
ncbi:hypothetical protein LCGC14_3073860, partial [marine sediment metagenome]